MGNSMGCPVIVEFVQLRESNTQIGLERAILVSPAGGHLHSAITSGPCGSSCTMVCDSRSGH